MSNQYLDKNQLIRELKSITDLSKPICLESYDKRINIFEEEGLIKSNDNVEDDFFMIENNPLDNLKVVSSGDFSFGKKSNILSNSQ